MTSALPRLDRLFAVANLFIVPVASLLAENQLYWDNSKIAGKGDLPAPYEVVPAYAQLDFKRLAELEPIPGAPGWLIALEVEGAIWTFPDRANVSRKDATLIHEPNPGDRLYSLTFYPERALPTRILIAVHTTDANGRGWNEIQSWAFDQKQSPPRILPNSKQLIIRWETKGHDGCDLIVGQDDMLYISTGDGQSPGDPANSGQATDNLLGSILRIDIAHSPYRVPPDNPFVNIAPTRGEVWAYGLRNPWRMGKDSLGNIWIGDNGEDLWESLFLASKGANYGWSAYESGRPFRPENLSGPNQRITPPVISHSHTEARSLIGGPEYSGDRLPELKGKILYGDYTTGRVWAFRWDPVEQAPAALERIADGPSFLGFGRDTSDEIVLLGTDSRLYRLVSNPRKGQSISFPKRLSLTGVYSSVKDRSFSPGIHRFEIATPLWRDGAAGRRFVGIPEGTSFASHPNRSWTLPNGGIAGITISKNGNPVETQLIQRDQEQWRFYSYVWDAETKDARLADTEGESILLPDGSQWTVPSQSDCRICHTAQSGFLLGFSDWQTQFRTDAIPRILRSQLPTSQRHTIPNFPQWNGNIPNRDGPLQSMARAYLHTNCAHCHREGAVAGRAQFEILANLPNQLTGAVNAPPITNLTAEPNAKIIAPGVPEQSALIQRMRADGVGRMPLIGSKHPDTAGIRLLETWIRSLAESP